MGPGEAAASAAPAAQKRDPEQDARDHRNRVRRCLAVMCECVSGVFLHHLLTLLIAREHQLEREKALADAKRAEQERARIRAQVAADRAEVHARPAQQASVTDFGLCFWTVFLDCVFGLCFVACFSPQHRHQQTFHLNRDLCFSCVAARAKPRIRRQHEFIQGRSVCVCFVVVCRRD